MYFWKVDNLVDDFKNDKVSQKEQFKYYLLFMILMILAADPILFLDMRYNIYDSINSISLLFVTIWGMFFCYKKNRQGDNKDFLPRLMCLSLPIAIRLFVIILPIFITVGIIESSFGIGMSYDNADNETYESTISQTLVLILFSIIYYVYLSSKIGAVSATDAPNMQFHFDG